MRAVTIFQSDSRNEDSKPEAILDLMHFQCPPEGRYIRTLTFLSVSRRLPTARCALFPLLEGEGQGEGKQRELLSRVSDHSWICRTGRVVPQCRRFPK